MGLERNFTAGPTTCQGTTGPPGYTGRLLGERYDAIVVGGGHNGLAASAYLGRAGLKTLVLERRPVLGGAAVSQRPWPGYTVSSLSYVLSLMPPEVIRELELQRHGLVLYPLAADYYVPFPDGSHLLLTKDPRQAHQEISKFSKKDASSFLRFSKFAARFVETIEPLLLAPPPSMADLLTLMKESPEMDEVVRQILMTSCKDLLNEFFESDEVKAEFCMHGVLNTSMSIDTVGTSYILANAIGKAGYRYVVGGMGAVAQAAASSFQSSRGIIRTNCEIKRIEVRERRAVGVELASGEKISARAVVSNADPKRTFLRLVDRDAFDDEFVKKVESLRAKGTSLKINIALREPLNFKAIPGVKIGPQHTALTDIAPSMAYVEKASDECKWGRLPREPPLSIFCQTASDPGCAPSGKHTLSIIAKYNPYHLACGNWDSLRETAQENALNVLERYAPNLRSAILHIETLTPLDMERLFGLTEGNVTHLDQTLNQMLAFRPLLGWANYRTPIMSLYLCGAGVHPGGGVTGAPGHNAAQALLEDWQAIKG